MQYFHTVSGSINITCVGDNGYIIRKNKEKVKIPSTDDIAKERRAALKKKENKNLFIFPKIEDHDTIISGKDTIINISCSMDKGKENPTNDWKKKESKTLILSPDTEVTISNIIKWDKVNEKEKTRVSGEYFKDVTVKKGLFRCDYTNCEDTLNTPIAKINFKNSGGSGVFDIYNDSLYTLPANNNPSKPDEGQIEFNVGNKKYITKKHSRDIALPEEIIITKDSVFRRPCTKIDQFLSDANFKLLSSVGFSASQHLGAQSEEEKKAIKDIPSTMDQAIGNLEMFKNMKQEDFERLISMSGGKITKEQKEMFKGVPDMIKKMEEKGVLTQMKKGQSQLKGMYEGLGDKGIDRMLNMQIDKEKKEELSKLSKDAIEILTKKDRKYLPLTSELKVSWS